MPISEKHSESDIASNIRAHDRVARKYERIHGEIYNSIEQARLSDALAEAVALVESKGVPKLVLDFGCGAGNLTKKLSDLNCNVIACDVSQAFLDLVASRQYPSRVDTAKLNGVDLSGIPDESVDMVATYSVLHHVPDYLGILGEFLRALRPGGIVFIDHEASEEVWQPTPERAAFLSEMNAVIGCRLCKYLKPKNYIDWFIRNFFNPRYQAEGDIHVYDDDHIEWAEVKNSLINAGAEILLEKDYLLYRRGYDDVVYRKHSQSTRDTHLLVARKKSAERVLKESGDTHEN